MNDDFQFDSDIKSIFREDITNYLVFYLFKKYLSMFSTKDIPEIADALAKSWAQGLIDSGLLDNEESEDVTNIELNIINDYMLKEVQNAVQIIYKISADAQAERALIDQYAAKKMSM